MILIVDLQWQKTMILLDYILLLQIIFWKMNQLQNHKIIIVLLVKFQLIDIKILMVGGHLLLNMKEGIILMMKLFNHIYIQVN